MFPRAQNDSFMIVFLFFQSSGVIFHGPVASKIRNVDVFCVRFGNVVGPEEFCQAGSHAAKFSATVRASGPPSGVFGVFLLDLWA